MGDSAREYAIAYRLISEDHEVAVVPTTSFSSLSDLNRADVLVFDTAIIAQWLGVGGICIIQDERLVRRGLVDELCELGVRCVGATKKVGRVELDKLYARQIASRVHPSWSPAPIGVASNPSALSTLCKSLQRQFIVRSLDGSSHYTGVSRAGIVPYVPEFAFPVLADWFVLGQTKTLYFCYQGNDICVLPPVSTSFSGTLEALVSSSGMWTTCESSEPSNVENELVEKIACEFARAFGATSSTIFAVEIIYKDDKFHFVEFDCRLGNPETSCLVTRLVSPLGDFFNTLSKGEIPVPQWKDGVTISAAITTSSYPDRPTVDQLVEPLAVSYWRSCGLRVDLGNYRTSKGRVTAGPRRVAVISSQASSVLEATRQIEQIRPEIESAGLALGSNTLD